MSWSINAFGKIPAVTAKVANEFEKITYLSGPEAELKEAASEFVGKILKANTVKGAIRVDCSGSGSNHPSDGSSQTIKIDISPIFGFVE